MSLDFESIKGRAFDLDSHENVPLTLVGEVFGERAQRYLEACPELLKAVAMRQGEWAGAYSRDNGELPITEQSVWESKGTLAPSSTDFGKRVEVLDAMGIERALVFPLFGVFALASAMGGGNARFLNTTKEQQAVAWDAVDAHNDWAAAETRANHARLRIAGIVPTTKPGMTLDDLVKETERQIKLGMGSLTISTALPPLGMSPARKELDPWYAMIAEANIALTAHGGSGTGYRASDDWARSPQFANTYNPEGEMVGDPLSVSSFHQAEENFIAAMVLGGVFERHPTLRFGAIELGGYWLGPLAERLDLFSDEQRKILWPGRTELKLRPSEYIARQVRVTPFVYEPLVTYLQRTPQLEDCYCYSSDYPHVEGNKWSMKRFYDALAPHVSDAFLEKFFVTNGKFLIPG